MKSVTLSPDERGNRSEGHRVSWRNSSLIELCLGSVRIKLQQHQEPLYTIEPTKKPDVQPRLFLWHYHRWVWYWFLSVSINVRNGVTGSLGDHATLLKLKAWNSLSLVFLTWLSRRSVLLIIWRQWIINQLSDRWNFKMTFSAHLS